MKNYRHPESLTCSITEQHKMFVKRILRYAERLKVTRTKIRKQYGKSSKNAEVHSAKLNVLRTVMSIFDRTVVDIERVKSAITNEARGVPETQSRTEQGEFLAK